MQTTRNIYFGAALAALTLVADAQDTLTAGLIGYYPFNGNVNDESGNGRHGAPNLSGFSTDRLGVANRSGAFAKNLADSILLTNTQTLTPTSFTLSMWFKTPRTDGQNRFLIAKGGEQMEIHLYSTGGIRFVPSPGVYIDTPAGFRANEWTHIVCRAGVTVDGGRVVINGIDAGAVAAAGNPTLPFTITTSAPLRIGQRSSLEQSHQFEGLIDDVRIYDRVLSRSEVLQIYAQEVFCSPHAAKATASLSGGTVTGATLTDVGCGYTAPPTVRIIGAGGSGATATAVIANGIVTDVIITNGGGGYTSAPKILIESPPFAPRTTIAVSRVKVTQHVRVNHNYQLESSLDGTNWTVEGAQFTAESEEVTEEFEVTPSRKFFRLREVP